jgi:multiple sugar transport system substrate-binding protein
MNRRSFAGTAIAVALAASMAVADTANAQQQQFRGVTLKWATLAPTGSVENLRALVSEWERETGGKVEIVIQPHPGLAEKVLLDAQTRVNTYDLVTLNYPKLGQFVEAGVVMPIDAFVANPSARKAELADYIPRLLEAYGKWDGKLYGVPLHADGRIMLYRKDVFAAHGKQPAKTWAEYLELAKYFNGKDWDNTGSPKFGVAFRFNADVISSGRFAEVQAGIGGRLIDDNWKPHIDTQQSRDAMAIVSALAANGPRGNLEMGSSEYVNTIRLGQVPQLIVWAESAATMDNPAQSKVVGKIGWAPVPGGAALLGGFGISILSASKNGAAAYDFMTWFTSRETERKRQAQNLFAPTRSSTYTDPEIVAKAPWYPLVKQNLANGVALPRIPEADEMINILGQGTRRAAAGQQPVDAMLKEVQTKWEQILIKAGRLKSS